VPGGAYRGAVSALPLAHGAHGDVLTPAFTVARLLSGTTVDPLPAALILAAAGLYLVGQWRLWQRGDRWSGWRTASWLVGGLGSIAVATMSGLAAYDETLFSAHMVQHMILSMVAPVFLALGAPVTLALRTLPGRPRGMLLAALHSRPARLLTFPPLGWALFVGSPFALYFSGWYPATLRHAWLHELLHLHFVVVGCLFLWPLIGLDPVPGKVAYPLRFLLVFAALPFHAILGISIMGSQQLIAADYYLGLHLSWSDPVSDQRVGGGLLWASGDLVGLLLLGAVAVQWMRASEREAVREDRRLDRLEARAGAAVDGPARLPVWWASQDSNGPDR
jgi:cytochrome c oxidase assembly factor CtaG